MRQTIVCRRMLWSQEIWLRKAAYYDLVALLDTYLVLDTTAKMAASVTKSAILV